MNRLSEKTRLQANIPFISTVGKMSGYIISGKNQKEEKIPMIKRIFILMIVAAVLNGIAFPQALRAADSTSVRQNVCKKLFKTYCTAIDVSVKDDTVTVTGSVPTYWDKCKIHQIIQTVPDVKAIRNYLIVKTGFTLDGSIRNSILCDIGKNAVFIHPDSIRVHVTNGLVILTGRVSSKEEDYLAFSIASWQKGVRSVVNDLKVDQGLLANSKKPH